MVRLSEEVWDSLFLLKKAHNHDQSSKLLQKYAKEKLSDDDFYDIAWCIVPEFYSDIRVYWNEESYSHSIVIFDPIITNFWHLCDEYEKRLHLKLGDNCFRKQMKRVFESAMCFDSNEYYDYISYDDTSKKNGCRFVLRLGYEFCEDYSLAYALIQIYDAFVSLTTRIKAAMAELDQQAGRPG